MAKIVEAAAAAHAGPRRTTRRWPRSSTPSSRSSSRTTPSSTSSATTTTTSPKPTSRAPTPTSRRTPASTTRSTGCATPPPRRSSPGATCSSSPRSPASTAWAAPRSTATSSSPSRRARQRKRDKILRHLIDIQYERNDVDFTRGKFRVRGDTLDIYPAYEDMAVRVEFWGDEIERIVELDPLTGEVLAERDRLDIYPAKHFVTSAEKLQAGHRGHRGRSWRSGWPSCEPRARCWRRRGWSSAPTTTWRCCARPATAPASRTTRRHLAGRQPGEQPWTLLDYFPDDFLLFVDESHMSLPQVRGMYHGDRARKDGAGRLRLPPALGPGQPPAHLRRVRAARQPGRLRLGHARPLRAGALGPGGRADHPAHRPGRSHHRGEAHRGPDRRPAGRDPRARRAAASAPWSPR